MTYEPYLSWACDQCTRCGQVPVPVESDPVELEYRALEAHAIAGEGSCSGRPRLGQLTLPDLANPLRILPSLF